MDRFGSFPLLSAHHSLFSTWTDLKRSEKIAGAPAWRWEERIWLTGPSGLHRNSPQGLNISSIRVFDQNRDPEIPITLHLHILHTYKQCYFFRGMRGYAYPLNIWQTSLEKNIHFHSFEIDVIQITKDRKLCKHSNFSAVCWLFCTVTCDHNSDCCIQPAGCILTSFPFP